MLDAYVVGSYNRNSPEADVPVILKKRREIRLGGAANVAFNLSQLGLSPILLSVIGTDQAGTELKELLQIERITSHLIEEASRPTTIKQRIVSEEFEQFLRIDTESTTDISLSSETSIGDYLRQEIKNKQIDGIVIQDYNKGVVSPYLIKLIQNTAEQYDIPLFVDPKHQNFELLASSCTVFKPNIKELSYLTKQKLVPDIDSITQALAQIKDYNATLSFVTLAEKGIYYQNRQGDQKGIVDGHSIENPDVSGAGDTVLATLIWSYFNSGEAKVMAEIANKAGSQVCHMPGVSAVSLEKILADQSKEAF